MIRRKKYNIVIGSRGVSPRGMALPLFPWGRPYLTLNKRFHITFEMYLIVYKTAKNNVLFYSLSVKH